MSGMVTLWELKDRNLGIYGISAAPFVPQEKNAASIVSQVVVTVFYRRGEDAGDEVSPFNIVVTHRGNTR